MQTSILCFEDVLLKIGLDPKKVKLIRHSTNSKTFLDCRSADRLFEYTCHQNQNFSNNYDYWVVFISDRGTLARLHSCYKVLGWVPDTPDVMPEGLPESERKAYDGTHACYRLETMDVLRDYEDKLVIDWGKAAVSWHQKGTTPKPIVAIHAKEKRPFTGFENVVLRFDELEEIINGELADKTWQTAFSSVKAVYLIVDTVSGKQYVGSAYGEDGLWGRWKTYVETHHGGNKLMVELLENEPERYHQFQFSVLRVLPMTMTDDDVIKVEALYKRKLLSKEFGMNDN